MGCDLDRNALGNARYQLSGKREVLIVPFSELQKLAKEDCNGRPFLEYYKSLLEGLTKEKIASVTDFTMYHAILGPKQFLHSPMACFLAERVIPSGVGLKLNEEEYKQSMVFGFRVHTLEGSDSVGFKNLKHMTEVMTAYTPVDIRDSTPELQFWKQVFSVLEKPSLSQALATKPVSKPSVLHEIAAPLSAVESAASGPKSSESLVSNVELVGE
jgi:hypothetical protein